MNQTRTLKKWPLHLEQRKQGEVREGQGEREREREKEKEKERERARERERERDFSSK